MTDQEPPTTNERSRGRLSVPWGITDAMIGFAIVACGSLASLLALGKVLGSLERQTDGITTVVLFLLQILMVVTVWLLAVKWRGASLTSLGLGTGGLRWPKIVGWAALALGLSIVAGLVYQLIVTGLGIESLEPSPVPERLLGEGVIRAFTVGILVVVGPAAEEIFFRGFLLVGIRAGHRRAPRPDRRFRYIRSRPRRPHRAPAHLRQRRRPLLAVPPNTLALARASLPTRAKTVSP